MIQVPCEFPHVPAGLDMEATEHACPGTGQVNHWDRDAAVNSASNVPGEGELMDGHPEPEEDDILAHMVCVRARTRLRAAGACGGEEIPLSRKP